LSSDGGGRTARILECDWEDAVEHCEFMREVLTPEVLGDNYADCEAAIKKVQAYLGTLDVDRGEEGSDNG
jgi:hypothetical protein